MTTSSSVAGSKSVLLARSLYFPGVRSEKLNRPLSSEVTDFASSLLWLTTLMVTPGSMAPDESKAMPVTAPEEVVCPEAPIVLAKQRPIAKKQTSTDESSVGQSRSWG